jgi:UDP-glucose 4-epimerase
VNPAARLYEVDIRSPAAREIFEREQPEVLNHHAAQMDVRHSVANPMFDADVNLGGFLNLLEAGRANGLKRVLFASSGGTVYGEQEQFPAKETHPTAPLSPYGITKLASEYYLHFYAVTYGLSYVALRYANVYGPRQNPHGEAGVVAIFAGKMLRGEPITVNGDGKQTRDYVFVGDVVQANLAALEREPCGAVNIGTGIETDVNRLAELMLAASGSASQVTHGPAKQGEQRRSVIDYAKAAERLGWKPSVPLAEGLRRTVEWFRQRAGKA